MKGGRMYGLVHVVLWHLNICCYCKPRAVVSRAKDWLLLFCYSMHTHTAHTHAHTQIMRKRREECWWRKSVLLFLLIGMIWMNACACACVRDKESLSFFKHIKTAEIVHIIEQIILRSNALVCYKRLPAAVSHSKLARGKVAEPVRAICHQGK